MTDPFSPTGGPAELPRQVNAEPAGQTEAQIKFKSCRWRRPPEDGPECCGHRDVLPILYYDAKRFSQGAVQARAYHLVTFEVPAR